MVKDNNILAIYEWGKIIDFTKKGNATSYIGDGWSDPEEGGTWTDSLNATLHFKLRPTKNDVMLALSCDPFLFANKITYQELTIYVNHLRAGLVIIEGTTIFKMRIPHLMLSPQNNRIDFYLPKATSPSSIEAGSDLRRLGIYASQLTIIQT